MSVNGDLMRRSHVIAGLFCTFLLNACLSSAEIAVIVIPALYDLAPDSNLSATPDQVVTAGQMVTLSPTIEVPIGRSDVRNEWRQTGGPAVRIEVMRDGTARFVAPEVESIKELAFRVRIEAGDSDIQEDTFVIHVKSSSE